MAQSVGPMTVLLCMIRSQEIYRKKWADAVKRSMSMISCIDDIIQVTKNHTSANEQSNMITLLAEILLITTSRQATRMHFPLCMLNWVYDKETTDEEKKLFL